MERYHQRPLESHPGTFDWIFDPQSRLHVCDFAGPRRPGRCYSELQCQQVEEDLRKHASRFQTWMETSDDTFWVQGKAGSGKSTFMKFLFEHEQTQEHLRHWAGGEVITAAFFFWAASSSELETSYLGLLRGLLFQVLQEKPELIELVFPKRWSAVVSLPTCKKPWTKNELVAAFGSLLQLPATNSKFCFFIDGLDEFGGDYRDLIDAINTLSKSPDIKICVSSRPWGVFKDGYGSNDSHQVALQSLTQRDIDLYITTRLEVAAPRSYQGSELRQLGNHVRDRSEGVFLWVSLAVKDLRRGIDGHDSMVMLQDRLKSYPPEIRDFIQLIFDGIDPAYEKFTGRLLLMMLIDTGPPALISLNFLEDSFTADGKHIFNTQWSPKSNGEMYKLIDRAAVCAEKWCRDLLEPLDTAKVKKDILSSIELGSKRCWRINFYSRDGMFEDVISHLSFGHRSMHEFAQEKADAGTLSRMAGQNFDHRLPWLCALVELSKSAPDLHDFVETIRRASCRLLDDIKHFESLLHTAEGGHTLADGIQHCFQAFDLVGQNIERYSNYRHWTTDRLADDGQDDPQLRRRIPTGECSSFVSYLICLTLPVFLISPILTRQYDSFTELQKQFVLETALIPHVYSDSCAQFFIYDTSEGCRLGRPTHYCDIIVQMITDGLDVNQATQRAGCHQHYSVWQFYLLWLHDYFHERPTFREVHSDWVCDHELQIQLIRDTTEVFRTFLIQYMGRTCPPWSLAWT
jgi:hypothetical protein